jgi:hypothetical protein
VNHWYDRHVCPLVSRITTFLLLAGGLQAYGVLTHEAIIDSAWDHDIKPILLQRFPQATPEELVRAHASAYAGCIIQDMGYYPFGSTFFSDLVHYVRTGDFVVNLLREAHTLNEFAFALGGLAHYAADTQGHGVATNRAVAIEYPKLAKKFGPFVTYADDKHAHSKVELSFDVTQIARGHYAPQAYHDFIGVQVEKEVLERAFKDTYSLELSDVFGSLDLALATYRRSISVTIPRMTRIAWQLNKDELAKPRAIRAADRRQFIYQLSRASYRKEWSDKYREPGVGSKIGAFFVKILPKIGPLKALKFHLPKPETEALFETSFTRALERYRELLADESAGRLAPDDRDFDTGKPTSPTEYRLADDAYAKLARELADLDAAKVDHVLIHHVLDYFRDLTLPYATKKAPRDWARTLQALDKLRAEVRAE